MVASVIVGDEVVDLAVVADDAHGLGEPLEADPVGPGQIVFIRKGRYQGFRTPVGDRHRVGPEPFRGGGDVDRGIACADDDDVSRKIPFHPGNALGGNCKCGPHLDQAGIGVKAVPTPAGPR